MPAKVIATMHQLAAACKKYKGIVFMDKEGNIINDTLEITGVDATNTETITKKNNTTGVNNKKHTAGVGNNTTGVNNNKHSTVHEHSTAPDTGNEPNITTDSQNEDYKQYDDDIAIENETPEDINVTIF